MGMSMQRKAGSAGRFFNQAGRSNTSTEVTSDGATTVSDYEAVSLSPEESLAMLERISDPLVRVLIITVRSRLSVSGKHLGSCVGC
jgi:hypothetical protein